MNNKLKRMRKEMIMGHFAELFRRCTEETAQTYGNIRRGVVSEQI
jgi:hypothetical protein